MVTNTPSTTRAVPPGANEPTKAGRRWRRLVAVVLALAVLFTTSYAAISIYIGTQIQGEPHVPMYATPA